MATMTFSQKLRQFARKFHFAQKDMESSYCQFQRDFETKFFSILNLVVAIILICSSPVIFLEATNLKEVLYRSLTLVFSIIAYLIRKKLPNLHKLILILVFVAWGQYSLSNLVAILQEATLGLVYEFGNVIGMLEMMLIMSAKNLRFRLTIAILIVLGKVASLYDVMSTDLRTDIVLGITVALSFGFCLIYDALDRETFKIIYESREKLKKFQSLLSNDFPSSVIILTMDLNSILYSNQFFKDNFKISETPRDIQTMSKEVFSRFFIEEREAKYGIQCESLFEYLQALAKNSKELQDKEVVTLLAIYRDDNKSQQHYEIKVREILWDDETSYALVLNNVSDKQTVIALKLADEQKDRVIATVSHELRTPINGILGLLEMAMARINDEASLNFLKHCKSCSKLLLYLVNSILDLSQLRHKSLRINKENFSLKEFLDELESLYLFQCQEKGVDFVIEVDQSVPKEICTDRYRLLEILINLLGNAMKFTFKGEIKMKISLQDVQNSKKILFYIQDTGIGIKEENKNQLFTMFGKITQRDKSINMHGAGLGLTISNELVKALNDDDDSERIDFKSEFEKGSAFWFRVSISSQNEPLSITLVESDETDEAAITSCQIKEYSSKGLSSPKRRIGNYSSLCLLSRNFHSAARPLDMPELDILTNTPGPGSPMLHIEYKPKEREVLIVDDNPFNILAASFVMENLGFKPSKAFNGQEALEVIERALSVNKKFALILTDIQMPILDGLGLSKIITDKISTGEMYIVPIIAITANPLDEKERLIYQEHGITRSLEKPLQPEVVKKVLDEVCPKYPTNRQIFLMSPFAE